MNMKFILHCDITSVLNEKVCKFHDRNSQISDDMKVARNA